VVWVTFGGAFAAMAFAVLTIPAQAQGRLPPDFVYLRDVDATIEQDMRYAGAKNFTGRPLPGYGAAECVLRRDAAAALKMVQDHLRGSGLSLKVYDCYRPQRAVSAMASWAGAPEDNATKRFYPRRDKQKLFAEGWISPRSRHSAGIAVDLTLVPIGSVTPRLTRADERSAIATPRNARPTTASTWAPASIASAPRAIRRATRSAPWRATIACNSSPPCVGMAFATTSANGGTSSCAAGRRR
jgi:D-alanyl-D-alanine dipeptidase